MRILKEKRIVTQVFPLSNPVFSILRKYKIVANIENYLEALVFNLQRQNYHGKSQQSAWWNKITQLKK